MRAEVDQKESYPPKHRRSLMGQLVAALENCQLDTYHMSNEKSIDLVS